jgi:hypothetical protein
VAEPEWKPGDTAAVDDPYAGPDYRVEIISVGERMAFVKTPGGFEACLPLLSLRKPAPKTREVVVRKWRHESGSTQWAEKNPHSSYVYTDDTRTFTVPVEEE